MRLQIHLPQDDLPEPSMKDFPALALHASVIAVRRPASLLLPATATLFCARCVAKVADIFLRIQESDRLNAWAGTHCLYSQLSLSSQRQRGASATVWTHAVDRLSSAHGRPNCRRFILKCGADFMLEHTTHVCARVSMQLRC